MMQKMTKNSGGIKIKRKIGSTHQTYILSFFLIHQILHGEVCLKQKPQEKHGLKLKRIINARQTCKTFSDNTITIAVINKMGKCQNHALNKRAQ